MEQLAALLDRLPPRLEPLIYSAVILAIGLVLAGVAESTTRRALSRLRRHVHISLEAAMQVARLARAIVFTLAVTTALSFWGFGLGGIWTGLLGLIAGVGVALVATWAMVSNITGAVFLSVWRPYRLGDTFEILPEAVKGRAIDRNLMFTVLEQPDGAIISIPNNLVFQRVVRCYPASPEALLLEDTPTLPGPAD